MPNDIIDAADIITRERLKTEEEFQSAILYEADCAGWGLRYHPYDSRRSESGYPDLTMVHVDRGLLVMAELKTDRGRVSPEQRGWLTGLRMAGVHAPLWRPRMASAISDWLYDPTGAPPGSED